MNEAPLLEQHGRSEPRCVRIRLFPSGAQFRGGQWEPTVVSEKRILFPYRRFVRSVLVELGYDVVA
jgi:hypothetical protein